MKPRRPTALKPVLKLGLSLLLAAYMPGPWQSGLIAYAFAEAAEGSDGALTLAAVTPHGEPSAACAAALQRALEAAPALLALADWPLDTTTPAECSADGGAALLAAVAEGGAVIEPAESAELAYPYPPTDFALDDAIGGAITGAMASAQQGSAAPPGLSAEGAPDPFAGKLVALADGSLDDDSLDGIRGGFELADSNLKFSFGIERAVFINGQLSASTVLNLRDLQWTVGTGKAPEVLTNGAPGALGVIQNGAGNVVPAQLGGNLAGTVIQNTLNNQNIQTVTTINAAVNSAQMLRSMSLQTSINNGIVNSLRR